MKKVGSTSEDKKVEEYLASERLRAMEAKGERPGERAEDRQEERPWNPASQKRSEKPEIYVQERRPGTQERRPGGQGQRQGTQESGGDGQRLSARQEERLPKRRKKKSLPIWAQALIGLGCVVAMLAFFAYLVLTYVTSGINSRQTTAPTMTNSGKQIVTPTPLPVVNSLEEGVHNILLVGQDTRNDGMQNLSDTIMILTINSKEHQLKLSSIQRDTELYIDGDINQRARINSAINEGVNCLINTVNKNFALDINEYIMIDMRSVIAVVDMLGGVEVDLPEDDGFISALNSEILYSNHVLNTDHPSPLLEKGGSTRLDGNQALAYMRLRSTDSDYLRTNRQRQILELMFQEFNKRDILTKTTLVKEVLNLVTTNLSMKDLGKMITDVLPTLKNSLQTMQIPPEGCFWEDESYTIVPGLRLVVPEIQQFIYGSKKDVQILPELPGSPQVYTDYYIEPGTERFVRDYSNFEDPEKALQDSQNELARQKAAGYVPDH